MINLKEEFSILKPKYVDNSRFLYCFPSSLRYIVNKNTVITKYIDTGFTKSFLVNVQNINSFDNQNNIVELEDGSLYFNMIDTLNNPNYMSEININEDTFNILNSIVSVGISPLDLGKISILNGKVKINYYHMQYCILCEFEINNKSLALDCTIDFDTIYYIYSMYKEFKQKKQDLVLQIFTLGKDDYNIGCNNVYVSHTSVKYNKTFLKNLYDMSISTIANIDISASNVYNKKFIIENSDGTLYKNLLKCMPDEITKYGFDKYDVLTSTGISILVGKL